MYGPEVDLRLNRVDVRVRKITKKAALDGDASTQAPAARRPLTRPELHRLWTHVRNIENFWTTLAEIEPGLVRRLAEVAVHGGWEILFVTTRPSSRGETVQMQTQRWLRAHGFEWPSVYVVNGSRGKVAAALELDAVIDDRAEHVLDVAADSHARPILVWRDQPGLRPPTAARIATVSSFADALKLLGETPAAGRGVRGLMRRVRATLRR